MLKTYKKLVAASKVSFLYCLNQIRLRSRRYCLWSLFHPFLGTFITTLDCENPTTENIVMFNFVDCRTNAFDNHGGFPLWAAIN